MCGCEAGIPHGVVWLHPDQVALIPLYKLVQEFPGGCVRGVVLIDHNTVHIL